VRTKWKRSKSIEIFKLWTLYKFGGKKEKGKKKKEKGRFIRLRRIWIFILVLDKLFLPNSSLLIKFLVPNCSLIIVMPKIGSHNS
jgi:hypothetical protein